MEPLHMITGLDVHTASDTKIDLRLLTGLVDGGSNGRDTVSALDPRSAMGRCKTTGGHPSAQAEVEEDVARPA